MIADVLDYNQIHYELGTIKMETDGFSDSFLIEECNHLSINFHSPNMEGIYRRFFSTGVLLPEDRKSAEAFYLLGYGELFWKI